ncbi:hypothetical protein MC885_019058 [Smutsia gigantea]|nr:hypothetical protein MC885_019058 [Smutsia gigantea]
MTLRYQDAMPGQGKLGRALPGPADEAAGDGALSFSLLRTGRRVKELWGHERKDCPTTPRTQAFLSRPGSAQHPMPVNAGASLLRPDRVPARASARAPPTARARRRTRVLSNASSAWPQACARGAVSAPGRAGPLRAGGVSRPAPCPSPCSPLKGPRPRRPASASPAEGAGRARGRARGVPRTMYTLSKGPSKLVAQRRTGPTQQQVESRLGELLKCRQPSPPTPPPPRAQPLGPWPLAR